MSIKGRSIWFGCVTHGRSCDGNILYSSLPQCIYPQADVSTRKLTAPEPLLLVWSLLERHTHSLPAACVALQVL